MSKIIIDWWLTFENNSIYRNSFFQLTTDKCKSLLVQAICNILMKCKDDRYRIVYILDQRKTTNTLSPLPPVSNPEESATTAEDPAESLAGTGATSHSDFELEWSPDEFHERLSIHNFESIDDVEKYYSENYHVLSGNYGVLLFMYAVLMTKVGLVVRAHFCYICLYTDYGFKLVYRNWRILLRNFWTHRNHWFTTHTVTVHKV